MNSGDVAPVIIFMTITIAAAVVLVLRGPVGRAIARRLEGPQLPESEGRLRELETRVADLEQERYELSERLEFAERVLAQVKETPRELMR